MEVRELRIGNYVYDPMTKAWLKVVELTESKIITTVVDRSLFPLPNGWSSRPIPLTEDILLKCGFVWNNDYEIFTIETKLTKDISITYGDNKSFKLLDIDYTVTIHIYIKPFNNSNCVSSE